MAENQISILAIDPGDVKSGYAWISLPDFTLREFGKISNPELLAALPSLAAESDVVAIEMIASYGMPVGKNVFDTCVWIGRFQEKISQTGTPWEYVYRKEEKISLCGTLKAKDANIRQALVDRYARHDFRTGKGTKANPDTFYGVSADVWQAIAVGVTWWEKRKDGIACQ